MSSSSDYSEAEEYNFPHAVVYQIKCVDESLSKETYIGSTTNFKKRQYEHKHSTKNIKNKQYNYRVYRHIREHGGWTLWVMEVLERYPCDTKEQLREREAYHVKIHDPHLNVHIPNAMHGITLKEYKKQYQKDNRDKILRKNNTKHVCTCGGKYTTINKKLHMRSHKHVKWMINDIAEYIEEQQNRLESDVKELRDIIIKYL